MGIGHVSFLVESLYFSTNHLLMHNPVLPLSNNTLFVMIHLSSRVCSWIGMFICNLLCLWMYCFGCIISVNASSASSSKRLFISLIVSSVASACLLGFTQSQQIPILCSDFPSTSHCVTHLAIPGGTHCPQFLLWKLCHVSLFFSSSLFWPQGQWFWFFWSLIGWSPWSTHWTILQSGDWILFCTEGRAPSWVSSPVFGSSDEETYRLSLIHSISFWSSYSFLSNWSPRWCQ